MSRVFEFLQKLNGGSGDLFANGELNSDGVDKILSVLHRSEAAGPSKVSAAFDLKDVPSLELTPDPTDRLVFHTDPNGLAADRFRLLRLRLRELSKKAQLKTVLITSPLPQDGKSTVAMNLAAAFVEHHRPPVLLIDADIHHSSLTQRLGVSNDAGLVNCLTTGLNPLQALRKVEPPGCYFLPAGNSHGDPGLLHTDVFSGVLNEVSPYFEWIIVDCPPVVPLTDAVSLMKHSDGALVVARADVTAGNMVEDAIALLGRERVIGVVLNSIEGLQRKYSRYHQYYYGSRSEAGEDSQRSQGAHGG